MNLHDHDLIYKTKIETKIENAKALIQMGKLSLEEIASSCGLGLDQVQKLAAEVK